MLAIGADREEINLIAPKVFQTFNKRPCFKIRLNIPGRFQSDPFSRPHPVMDNQAACRRQRSTNGHVESLPAFLERPRIAHPPASNKTDAVVLPQVLRSLRSAMAFQVGRRRADNPSGGQDLLGHYARIRRKANAQGHIQSIIDNIQAGVR